MIVYYGIHMGANPLISTHVWALGQFVARWDEACQIRRDQANAPSCAAL